MASLGKKFKALAVMIVGIMMCFSNAAISFAESEKSQPRAQETNSVLSSNELKEIQNALSAELPNIEGLMTIGIRQRENRIVLGVSSAEKYAEAVQNAVWSVVVENGHDPDHVSFDDLFVIEEIGIPSARNGKKTGWIKTADGTMYYKDGVKVTKSTVIDGIRYKFSASGLCEGKYTGWTRSSKGRRYWKNGELIKNQWLKTKSGKYYYADGNGYTVTGWYEVARNGGRYSYFDENGVWDGKIYDEMP